MKRRLIGVVGALGLALLVPSQASADDFGFREYTYGASTCVGVKDPMNFYFGLQLGFLDAATGVIDNTVGWRMNPIASDQWFHDDGVCQKQDRQRAEFITGDRHHTRLNQGRRLDPQFLHITASPMHHDSVVWWCGDVADSFDSSRNLAAQRIQAAGWFAVFTQTGNSAGIVQCDGRVTRSDGRYVLARN